MIAFAFRRRLAEVLDYVAQANELLAVGPEGPRQTNARALFAQSGASNTVSAGETQVDPHDAKPAFEE
jgi:hypothetical protein